MERKHNSTNQNKSKNTPTWQNQQKKHAAKSATTATSHRYYLSRSPCRKMAMDCGTLELHDASEGVRENFRGMGRMWYLKRRTPTTFACVCVCVSIFFCLFVSDGRCLMVIESIFFWNHHKSPSSFFLLNMLSGSFNVEPGSTSFLQRIERHDIADRHQNKWLFQTASLFCIYIFSFVIWICRFSSQIHYGAIAGHCWYPVSSSSVCSKGGWSLEQILALPGRWAVLCHCTLPWENKMDMDGYAWKWRDLDTSNHWFVQRTALGLCGSIHVWGHGFPSSFNSLVVSYAARGRRRIERPHHLKMMRVMFLAFRKKPFTIYVGLVSWYGVYVGL